MPREKFNNQVLSAGIAVLLVSVSVTSLPFYALPANAIDTSPSFPTGVHDVFHHRSAILYNALQEPRVHKPVQREIYAVNPDVVFSIPNNASSKFDIANPVGIVLHKSTVKASAAVGEAQNDGYCGTTSPPAGKIQNCGNLQFGNATVMHNAKIILNFWAGKNWNCRSGLFDNATIDPTATNPNDCSYMNLQAQFIQDSCADQPFTNMLAQYPDKNGAMGQCKLYSPPAGKSNPVVMTNPFPRTPLSFSDIAKEANATLNYYGLQADNNTEVVVFFPYGISSCADNARTNCFNINGTFCGYHSWTYTTRTGNNFLAFVNMPDLGNSTAGCGFPTVNSPNRDPIGDVEINVLSHEIMESLTDPYTPKGWVYGDVSHEIGDECNFDNGFINPDQSNVHLGPNGNPYVIQTEWSNSNNGCTFDLGGSPAEVGETIKPDSTTGTNATAPPLGFPITFQEGGESTPTTTIRSTNATIYVTPGTSVTTGPVLSLFENWCLDASCNKQNNNINGDTNISYYYYDLLHQLTSVFLIGGGSPTVNLSYVTAPSSAGAADTSQQKTTLLNATEQTVLALRGSAASIPQCTPVDSVCGPAGEKWITPDSQSTSWNITSSNEISDPVHYNHQFLLNMTSNPLNGGSVSPGNGWFDSGTKVMISSSPADKFGFASWSSNAPSIAIAFPLSYITAAKIGGTGTITANFQAGISLTYQFIYGQTDCENFGGSWDGANCTFSSLTVPAGISVQSDVPLIITGTLTIGGILLAYPGLTVTDTSTVNNSGELDMSNVNNSGTMVNTGTIFNHGTTTNIGTINNEGLFLDDQHSIIANSGNINNTGTIFSDYAKITNSGSINNNADGTIIGYNGAKFINNNILNNNAGSTLNAYVNNTATITNTGDITGNYATIDNRGSINNNANGTISNTAGDIYYAIINNYAGGTIANNSTITINDFYSGHIENNAGGIINNNSDGIIDNYHTIDNQATIVNDGTINNSGNGGSPFSGAINNHSGGTITNRGTIIDTGTVTNYSGGIINNNSTGIFYNNDSGCILNGGTITNSGILANNDESTITNNYLGIIINNSGGSITNSIDASFSNTFGSTFTNNSGGTITNSGIITEYGTGMFTNDGTINNNSDGEIDNNAGNVTNDGTITNHVGGTIFSFAGATITNTGTINNAETITNGDPIYSNPGDIITNSGTINNSGTITNNALSSITNSGAIANSGTITNGDSTYDNQAGTINNNAGGTITNTGTIDNIASSNIISHAGGTINNNLGGIINNNHQTTLDDLGSLNNADTFDNHGTLHVDVGGSLANAGTVINRCDGTIVISGALTGNDIDYECGILPFLIELCSPPISGDWIITSSCTLSTNATAPANVLVQSGAVLTIQSNEILTIHFSTNHLLVKSGSGVLIKSGGAIK